MARAQVLRVTDRVERLNVPGGDVWAYTRRLCNEVMALAIATCPKGETGELEVSHRTRNPTPLGKIGCVGAVRNVARHALFVHEGTGIYGPTGMPIVAPPGKRFVFVGHRDGTIVATRTVLGQEAQPWLRDAMTTVMLLNR